VRHWTVDNGKPEDGEDKESTELHTLNYRTSNQGYSNNGEHCLKYHKSQVGNGSGID
jgi:hypothetical protein